MASGLDYAGGRPSGASIRAAGYEFVCRYLTDGGAALPGKQLLPGEVTDLVANGVQIVTNFETYADRMLGGAPAGVADAQFALDYVRSLPGAPGSPVVYYSADFDVAPAQQEAVNDYLRGAGSVHGGSATVGIYGGYWAVHRALDAGVAGYAWQTQAWSGGNVDPRISILQRTDDGYVYVDGVQCDVDISYRDDYGQWSYGQDPGEDIDMAAKDDIITFITAYVGPIISDVKDIRQQLVGGRDLIRNSDGSINWLASFPGWKQLGQNAQGENFTVVDALADVRQRVIELEAEVAALKQNR